MTNRVEQDAEAIVVTAAVLSGACSRCKYLAECEAGAIPALPPDAWCSRKKERYAAQLREKRSMRNGGDGP